ncbi:MAG TPA: VTT domain-containing protein [Gemmatimonadaceae bacterium]|nr:VTT domain-containing protein [Gemmatimonadaceae bacterium]
MATVVSNGSAPSESGQPNASNQRLRLGDWVRIALPIIFVFAFMFVAWRLGYFKLRHPQHLGEAADRVRDVPWLGPIFVSVYAAMGAFAAPVSPLAYGAGAVFGPIRGTFFVWLASLIGAAGGYWMARGAWSGTALRLLGRYAGTLHSLRAQNTFLMTFRVQLLPIIPFGVFNYAAGASRLPFLRFMLGTALGIIPGTVAAVYIGDRISEGVGAHDTHAFEVAGVVAALLLVVSFSPTLIQKLRKR